MLANSTAFYLSDIDCREAVRTAACVQLMIGSIFALDRLRKCSLVV